MMRHYKKLQNIKINLKFRTSFFSPKRCKLWQNTYKIYYGNHFLSVQFSDINLKHTFLYMTCKETGLPLREEYYENN